jgi:hypothetical protein
LNLTSVGADVKTNILLVENFGVIEAVKFVVA